MSKVFRITRKKLAALAAASAICSTALFSPALAGPKDDSLIVAWGSTGPIENVDNYFNTNRTGIWFSRMVWDQLIYREPKTFEYKPLLAESWKALSPTTWQFKLRKNVKFHNGEPFDADDVVFTLNWISRLPNSSLAASTSRPIFRLTMSIRSVAYRASRRFRPAQCVPVISALMLPVVATSSRQRN